MPCYHKRKMYPPKGGQGRWCFDPTQAPPGAEPVEVACGQCQGCRVRRTGEWVIRNLWELDQHSGVACFATLTYDDEHLPDTYSVEVRHLQLFLKRLRGRIKPCLIRFYAVGEYGDDDRYTRRPHFHIIIYGWEPPDLTPAETSQRDLPQWESPLLSEIWGKGRVRLGSVNRRSIGYVAGYIFDKRNGDQGKALYSNRLHPVSGELVDVRPPFNVMSRRPGIGAGWWAAYSNSDACSDFVILEGRKRPMPRYVLRQRLAAMSSDEEREAFKAERRAAAAAEAALHAADNTRARLLVREVSSVLKAKQFARGVSEWSPERIQRQIDDAGEWAARERGAGVKP